MSKKKDFEVFQSSTGLGLKALRKFKIEEEIIEYTGRHITDDDLNDETNLYLFQLNEKNYIDGSGLSNLARYINHSCKPNAQAFVSHDEKSITIEAIKTIKRGDEIVIDYGQEYFDAYIAPIGCGCTKCKPKRKKS
jgi:SET domain-containing protein